MIWGLAGYGLLALVFLALAVLALHFTVTLIRRGPRVVPGASLSIWWSRGGYGRKSRRRGTVMTDH